MQRFDLESRLPALPLGSGMQTGRCEKETKSERETISVVPNILLGLAFTGGWQHHLCRHLRLLPRHTLWHVLPGPWWAKVAILTVMAAAVLYGLVFYVFPWISELTTPQDATVG